MACSCPIDHSNHEGVKVPRSSLKNTMKYGLGDDDVWVFSPEFLASQATIYNTNAIRAMDDMTVADAAAKRIWEKNAVYGKGEFSWKAANALEAANEAVEKACAANAEMNLAMKNNMLSHYETNNETNTFNSAGAYASQMFEEFLYLKHIKGDYDSVD